MGEGERRLIDGGDYFKTIFPTKEGDYSRQAINQSNFYYSRK